MELTICYYDREAKRDELLKVGQAVQQVAGGQVLMIPKDYDLLLDCSLDQLVSLKAILDTAIGMKFNEQLAAQGVNISPPPTDNIINIQDYLSSVEVDDESPKRGEIINMSDYLS